MELLKSILGTFLRAVLASVGGWLIAKGYVTEADWNSLLTGGIMALAAVLWGVWQKYKSRLTFLAALELPVGSSEEEAKVKASDPKIAARVFTLLALISLLPLVGGQMACAKKIPGESAEAYKARAVAIRVDQAMVGFDLAQDFLIVLSDYEVIGDAKQPAYFALHDRALSAFDVVALRLQSGLPVDANDKQQLISRIDAVLVDCDKIVKELGLLNDPNASAKAVQVVSSIRLALNSIKIIVAASDAAQPSVAELKAQYHAAIAQPKGPKPGWWDAAVTAIANQVSKMLLISAYTDPASAWSEAFDLSKSMHGENANRQ